MAKKETVVLSRSDLKYLLIDSLKEYSEDVAYIAGNNPYKFALNKKTAFIFIHNTHSTGEGRGNADECRIQISKSEEFVAPKLAGTPILFLGYSAEHRVFTAWNPFALTERANKRQVISKYSRFSSLTRAQEAGISVYIDNKKEHVVSFRPEYLGLYLENYSGMHVASEEELKELIDKSDKTETSEEGASVQVGKEKYKVTHKKFARDVKFRVKIAEFYDSRCAACGIQLELVEAAHIIPFSHEEGTDDPQNGICLCVLHHRAYDSSLIYFTESFEWLLNKEKVEYLRKMKRDGGIMKFSDGLNKKLDLPKSAAHYPAAAFIRRANAIRGIP